VDRIRLSAIAHDGMSLCNPVSSRDVDDVVDRLALPPGSTALDIGCGKAELLARIVERYGGRGIGVDWSEPFLEEARVRVAGLDIELLQTDASTYAGPPGRVNVALCVGAEWLLGGLRPAVARLASWTEPGGSLILGVGFWRRPPEPDYLAALGAQPDEMLGLDATVAATSDAGCTLEHVAIASDADWAAYEQTWADNLERFAATNPTDPAAAEARDWARGGRDRFLRWGRDTLGFALLLLRMP
jgi:cyclopropane fatty-acyl-phospholipid synthase-like methyltransferase